MKKLLLLSAITILLTACGAADKGDQAANPDSEGSTVNADTVLDNQLFSQAVSSGDAGFCDGITGVEKKTECQGVITAIDLTKQALTKSDKNICKKIELKRYKENCLTSVEDQMAADEKQAKEFSFYDSQSALADKYAGADDLEGCKKIEDENFKKQCTNNVLYGRALKSKDPKYCDQVEDKNDQEFCRKALNSN